MTIQEKAERRTNKLIEATYDLVVVGGGLSGVCCSIAAARNGIRVALIQDRPVLGGNASSEVRVWALGATSHMGNNNRWAREGGIIDEIMVENMHRNREGNPLLFDALLLEKVINEPNLFLFLNTVVYDIDKSSKDKIKSIWAFNSQNSTSFHIAGTYFCDASGDGILGYMAGATFRIGAEETVEFDEGFSPSEEYGQLLGHTIFLYSKKTEYPVKYVAPSYALQDITKIPKLHQITPAQFGCNYWWFEYGGNKDTIYDSEEIKMELWRVVYGAWNYIKNSGVYPEAENMTLEWVGMIPGKRESRRFEGLYMMTQHDIVNQTVFPDAVAYGGWAIDLHPAEGVYSSSASCNQYHSKGIYSIPYRSYVCKDIANLFLVGRLISVSHVTFGSTRVMITSALGGQAVGTAAALCCKKQCMPAELVSHDSMSELQYLLNYNGQSIPHIAIDQGRNLLSKSVLSASSSMTFNGFPFDGDWRELSVSFGQMLPFDAGIYYRIEIEVKCDTVTDLTVDLMISSKSYNYTPDLTLDTQTHHLNHGIQRLSILFQNTLAVSQYAFILFKRNDHVAIRTSEQRITGILSVFNKFNKAVNNLGKQIPPANSGFESFDFFTPERRPGGKNIAFNLFPSLQCFAPEQLRNGYIRPYLRPNAWVADLGDEKPELMIDFGKLTKISRIRLYFDTDYDHPMETVQWNHPENDMPFCVSNYQVFDDQSTPIASVKGNYQTINTLEFSTICYTKFLRIIFERKYSTIPVSLFQIEIN